MWNFDLGILNIFFLTLGTCYRVTPSFTLSQKKKKSAEPKKPKTKKKYVVPEFEQPTVLKEDESVYEEEILFEPPPAEVRSRAHIEKILGKFLEITLVFIYMN